MIKLLNTAKQQRNRRGFFSTFLEALHESRRSQARREIQRCKQLFPEAPDFVNSHLLIAACQLKREPIPLVERTFGALNLSSDSLEAFTCRASPGRVGAR